MPFFGGGGFFSVRKDLMKNAFTFLLEKISYPFLQGFLPKISLLTLKHTIPISDHHFESKYCVLKRDKAKLHIPSSVYIIIIIIIIVIIIIIIITTTNYNTTTTTNNNIAILSYNMKMRAYRNVFKRKFQEYRKFRDSEGSTHEVVELVVSATQLIAADQFGQLICGSYIDH